MEAVIAEVLAALRCPHCAVPLEVAEGPAPSLQCANGHAFDVARQGYVNLLPGGAHTGTADTPAMVAAREEFLARGHFEPLATAVAEAVAAGAAGAHGLLVEVGAGTGYYLARALDALPGRAGVALDISKHAARRAARAHPRAGAVVCDAWRAFPLATGSAAVILDVFAPRNAPEMARVLAPGGALVVATPTGRHLQELVGAQGMLSVDARKAERLAATLEPHFELAGEREVEYEVKMSAGEIAAAVAMGPSAHHTPPVSQGAEATAGERGAAPTLRDVTVSVRIGTYRPLPASGGDGSLVGS